MEEYIVHRRFKKACLSGRVNIPCLTKCHTQNGIIMLNNAPICYVTSEDAHQYFAVNYDGKGLLRGQLTQAIQRRLLSLKHTNVSRREELWKDPVCLRYRRREFTDHWLWNHLFFNASIHDLKYIYNLIS